MQYYNLEVEILVNGKPVKKFSHEGKTFIQANKGSEYSIRLKNSSWIRRLYVCSVDGINVIDGKAAGSSKAGYVIDGYSSYTIPGFRTSNEEAHPFKFGDKKASYAAKSEETGGDVSNCGVIGVMVYDELIKFTIPMTLLQNPNTQWDFAPLTLSNPNLYACKSNSASDNTMLRSYNCCIGGGGTVAASLMDSAPSESVPFSAGTEFSQNAVQDKVVDTEFEIGGLYATIEIYYDYREGLIAMGVPVVKEAKVSIPQAFPNRFCKPPR